MGSWIQPYLKQDPSSAIPVTGIREFPLLLKPVLSWGFLGGGREREREIERGNKLSREELSRPEAPHSTCKSWTADGRPSSLESADLGFSCQKPFLTPSQRLLLPSLGVSPRQ